MRIRISLLVLISLIMTSLAHAAPNWGTARTVPAKAHKEAVIDPLDSREIQVTRIAVTNDSGNLYVRLTTDANLATSLKFNYNPDHEFKYVAPEVVSTTVWFDTGGGGEPNQTFKQLSGIDYALRIDQQVGKEQLPNGMVEGYLAVTLSKYKDGNWKEVWKANSIKGKNVLIEGNNLTIQVPLSKIGNAKQMLVKQCNSTMLFDPKHYTEMSYNVQ